MSHLIGDKLYESASIGKAEGIIEDLKTEVEFPDVRQLVNAGHLGLDDVLRMRKRSVKFRSWLQNEAGRDRNAIIAYHNEVAKELGILSAGRSALSIFGVLGGGALGAVVGNAVGGAVGGALGGAVGAGAQYLSDVASAFGGGWKPIVFGDWLRNRIEQIVDKS